MAEENTKLEEIPEEPAAAAETSEKPAEQETAEPKEKKEEKKTDRKENKKENKKEDRKEDKKEDRKEKQAGDKKEKKPCGLVRFFSDAKNAGSLIVKCFLMLLLALVCAYAGLMLWGLLDKYIPTFYYGAYCAVGTAAAFLLAGLALIIVMIVRYAKSKKKK